MKRLIVGVVLAVVVFAAGAVAQDRFYAFRTGHMDVPLPAGPCGFQGIRGPVTMTVYDRSAWVVYTCNDDRVILRRFMNPNDTAITPQPVYTVAKPGSQPIDPLLHPDCPAYPGMVPSRFGGCVPPDHPDAK